MKQKKYQKECAGIIKFELAGGTDKVYGSQACAKNRLVELKNELPHALAQRALEKKATLIASKQKWRNAKKSSRMYP